MAQGGCRGNAAPGGARLCSAARPSACPALLWAVRPSQLLQQMSSLNETQHQPISCCYRTSISGKLSKKKKKEASQLLIFWLLKYSFSPGSKNCWKWWCVHPSHTSKSHSLLLPQCPAPLSCLQDADDVRKGRVCTPGAELFLLQLSQLRERSPGKGHKLGLHVQPVSKPQFILINIISAAVKLDKII